MREVLSRRDHSTLYLDRSGADGPVVLKVLDDEAPPLPVLARFLNELTVTRDLKVPGIRNAISRARVDNRPALVLRYFEGKCLDEMPVVHDRAQLVEQLWAAVQVAQTLGDLHAAGVLHRDIKPTNILVNDALETCLIDFGLAISLRVQVAESESARLVGTMAFIAPEQTGRMNRGVDHRADLYALGATLHCVMTGRPPFDSRDPLELVHCHLAVRPRPIHEINPNIPLAVSRIVAKLLEKDPDDRYRSAHGVRADLELCLRAARERAELTEFQPGHDDAPPRFAIPGRLYGRETEKARLEALLAPQAQPRLGTVIGGSGFGKTVLVGELRRPLAVRRGVLVSGKHEQLAAGTPYRAFRQALSALVDQLLTADEHRLGAFQAGVREAIGDLGRAALPVAPNLALLVGDLPEVPPLEGAAAHHRMRYVLQRLLRAVCSDDHPVAIFLDDLQWADLASLELIQALVLDPELRALTLLVAWRSGEVGPTHAVAAMTDELREAGADVQVCELGPLQATHTADLLADATGRSPADCAELARLVHHKTGGNPFFVHRFLTHLADRGVLRWDAASHAWLWQSSAVAASQASDNIAELLTDALIALPDGPRRIARVAACLGHRFSLATLAAVAECSTEEAAARLLPALTAGLVVALDDGWLQVGAAAELAREVHAEFAFGHDRIQAAAYGLGTEAERQALHDKIAERLGDPATADNARLFEIVRHLAQATRVAPGSARALERARAHRLAAERALATGAFAIAAAQVDLALSHLTDEVWRSDPALAIGLHLVSAQVGAQTMEVARTTAAAQAVLDHPASPLDRAAVRGAQAIVAMAQEDLGGALAIGRSALADLGIRVPERPTPLHIIAALVRVRRALGGRLETLVELPTLTDAQVSAALELMNALMPAAFRSGSHLFPIFVFEMVRLSVLHGNSQRAGMAYGAYAIAQCAVFGNYAMGYRFATLANAVGDRHRSVANLFIFHNFIQHWREPLGLVAAGLARAHRVGQELGDLYQATWSACYRGLYQLTTGVPLAQVSAYFDAMAAELRWDEGCVGMRRMVAQVIANLVEPAAAPHRLDGHHYAPAWVQKRWAERHDKTEFGFYHLWSAVLCTLFDAVADGVEHVEDAERCADGLNPMYFWPLLQFHAVVLRAQVERKQPSFRRRRAMGDAIARLRGWARQNPTNYQHLYEAAAAEAAVTAGKYAQAQAHFDAAIRTAQHHAAPGWQLGLILRQAARFFAARNELVLAQVLHRQAMHAWSEWGATALVDHHREATVPAGSISAAHAPSGAWRLPSSASSSDGETAALDLQAVLKASATISAEIVMERLTERLVRIMAQHAGAQVGALLLRREGVLRVEVELEGDEVRATPGLSPERSNVVAAPIALFVARTGEPLVIGDALSDPRFGSNAEVQARRVRSVLCAPIVRQGRADAVIYFENNATTDAFSADRLQVLSMLSVQAGTAIENADLYRNLEDKVRERTAELERQRGQLAEEKAKSEELLLNILPAETARELKATGRARARRFEGVTVLFADIVGFSAAAAAMDPEALVSELDDCFRGFDAICERHGMEKIKTIGDAYMAAGGVPEPGRGTAHQAVQCALDMQAFMNVRTGKAPFRVRLGLHTGPVVAGVVGSRKFAWDIWGDTVNVAARMEQNGAVGRVNVSAATWALVRQDFAGESRGAIYAKNIGELEMVFVDGPIGSA